MSDSDPLDVMDKIVKSYITRIVALFIPVLSGVISTGLFWLQNAVGIDLQVDPAASAAFLGTVVLGTVLAGWAWLKGRWEFEKTALEAKAMYEVGRAEQTKVPGV